MVNLVLVVKKGWSREGGRTKREYKEDEGQEREGEEEEIFVDSHGSTNRRPKWVCVNKRSTIVTWDVRIETLFEICKSDVDIYTFESKLTSLQVMQIDCDTDYILSLLNIV